MIVFLLLVSFGYFLAHSLKRKRCCNKHRELQWEHGMCEQKERDLLECVGKNKAFKDAAEEYNRRLIAKIKAIEIENQALIKENETLVNCLDYLNHLLNKKELERAERLSKKNVTAKGIEATAELISAHEGIVIKFVPLNIEQLRLLSKKLAPRKILYDFFSQPQN